MYKKDIFICSVWNYFKETFLYLTDLTTKPDEAAF